MPNQDQGSADAAGVGSAQREKRQLGAMTMSVPVNNKETLKISGNKTVRVSMTLPDAEPNSGDAYTVEMTDTGTPETVFVFSSRCQTTNEQGQKVQCNPVYVDLAKTGSANRTFTFMVTEWTANPGWNCTSGWKRQNPTQTEFIEACSRTINGGKMWRYFRAIATVSDL